MTQEQLKENLIEYAQNNMHNLTILQAINELLNSIINELLEDGYVSTSNRLTTCYLTIKELIENE